MSLINDNTLFVLLKNDDSISRMLNVSERVPFSQYGTSMILTHIFIARKIVQPTGSKKQQSVQDFSKVRDLQLLLVHCSNFQQKCFEIVEKAYKVKPPLSRITCMNAPSSNVYPCIRMGRKIAEQIRHPDWLPLIMTHRLSTTHQQFMFSKKEKGAVSIVISFNLQQQQQRDNDRRGTSVADVAGVARVSPTGPMGDRTARNSKNNSPLVVPYRLLLRSAQNHRTD
uniref:Uncharacterized protein n=1 Tax=Onchocerca volvulus TaxID=6282 RepID=A0A8R1TV47_ONCVO